MLDFDLYCIKTTDDEWNSSRKEFFTSFEEAIKARKKYSDWYRQKGCVTIEKIAANTLMKTTEEWTIGIIGNGKQAVVEYFNWLTNEHKENYKEGLGIDVG